VKCECIAIIDTALFVLQNPTDFEEVRGLRREICTASHDAYLAISIKAEVLSDAEEEEHPVPITFVRMKAEPEVSCVSVSMFWDFTNTGISHFVITRFTNFCYSEQLIFISKIFVKAEKNTHNRSRHHHPPEYPTIPVCPHALFLYRIRCAPGVYILSINICVICALHGSLTGERFCKRRRRGKKHPLCDGLRKLYV
jgi:hypothetical protein